MGRKVLQALWWLVGILFGSKFAVTLDIADSFDQIAEMSSQIVRLHIALADTHPCVWRRVDVPVDANLKMLHDVIQAAFGWLDCHLWEFEVGEKRYGVPDPDWGSDDVLWAKNTKLQTLLDRDVRRWLYTYDMGDNWEHEIVVEALADGEPDVKYPRYVDGHRRAPPEDCGGAPGFEVFLEAVSDRKHPEHNDVTRWYDDCYGLSFDPDTIDEDQTKFRIAAIAKRRAAGKASRAKV